MSEIKTGAKEDAFRTEDAPPSAESGEADAPPAQSGGPEEAPFLPRPLSHVFGTISTSAPPHTHTYTRAFGVF